MIKQKQLPKIDKSTKGYIEASIRKFHTLVKERDALRTEIILSASRTNDGQPKRKEVSKPTESKACSLILNNRLQHLENLINAIENIFSQLPADRLELIKYKYWGASLNAEALAYKLHVDKATIWRWMNKVIEAIAIQSGV